MLTRRQLIKSAGLAGASAFFLPVVKMPDIKISTNFRYCLNTSTIRGQQPGLKGYIDIVAEAGYDGIEVWVKDVQDYLNQGNSASELKAYIKDRGLKVENAIGFAAWMVEDKSERKAGLDQMKRDMEMMASIGCNRIAAPPFGVKTDRPVDFLKAGRYFAELLDLGRKTGVMPQLEFWGASGAMWHLGQVLMVAAAANDPDVRILADVYHLFRGGSGFEGLKMLNGELIEIFHVNDFISTIPREKQKDSDRVYPGDGVAPLKDILTTLKNMGGSKVLSIELFNEEYYKQKPSVVAATALRKLKDLVE
jgi:sugar phosphate isomerase/epimerase